MRIFGLEISLGRREKQYVQPLPSRGGWLPIIRESFAGAWQNNVEIRRDVVLTYFAVFACMTLIASDISKLRIRLMSKQKGVWQEDDENPSSSRYRVLNKPNKIQNRIQFIENWILSKLSNGNAYILLERTLSGEIRSMYVLDPNRVQPLIASDGTVFYQLSSDDVSGINTTTIVPSREIIHDRMNCLFHPLIGISPVAAAGIAAMQGFHIQKDSVNFFKNRAIPSGVLTAPGSIGNDTAERMKAAWDEKFSGENSGRVAILGDGLKFEKMTMTATDSQTIEQLKWTAEMVCSVFHVPPYKIGVGQLPSYNNIQSLNVEYYSQALQILIESIELCLDEALSLPHDKGTDLDLDGLLRMDTRTQVESIKNSITAGFMSPNEGRARMNMPAVPGGESPYLQQQNFSLAALAKRDSQQDPFGSSSQSDPQPEPEPEANPDDPSLDQQEPTDNEPSDTKDFEDEESAAVGMLEESKREQFYENT